MHFIYLFIYLFISSNECNNRKDVGYNNNNNNSNNNNNLHLLEMEWGEVKLTVKAFYKQNRCFLQ